MQRLLTLAVIALITFLIILFLARPDLAKNVWLWIIGFAGPIVKGFDSVINRFTGSSHGQAAALQPAVQGSAVVPATQPVTPPAIVNNAGPPAPTVTAPLAVVGAPGAAKPAIVDSFQGTTLTVLRYYDDTKTSVGLLFVNDKFYCYTLEDSFHEPKIPKITRIPAGIYELDFNRADTRLTLEYRRKFPWFTYHFEIKKIPNFVGVYIHIGNTSEDTEGCLLVAGSTTAGDKETFISHSTDTFKRLYQFLSDQVSKGIKMRIILKDESWISKQTKA